MSGLDKQGSASAAEADAMAIGGEWELRRVYPGPKMRDYTC